MVDQLGSFADEVTRVAREVGTEGQLGGQAEVDGVSGTWRDLTENVNQLAGNLTDQVRNIAEVTTAVANGDLSQKITVDARGEILELKDTVNTMVDQLGSFADEVTRMAREVGTEGQLGGQAQVEGVSGTWRDLTENVNQLASNLTTQVRAIAEVSTAVTQGDLTRSIAVEARGEVADLKDNINQMIANLRDTTVAQPGAGLAQDRPRAGVEPDAGRARPRARDPGDRLRADPDRLRPARRVLPGRGGGARQLGAAADRELRIQAQGRCRRAVRVRRGAGGPGRVRAQDDPAHRGARRTT